MNEQEANLLLELIGEAVVSIYGINYAAVVKDVDDSFDIQICYNKHKITDEFTTKNILEHTLNTSPIIKVFANESFQKFNDRGGISLDNFIETEVDFVFQNSKLKPGYGVFMKGGGKGPGTIGAFVKLQDDDATYLLSNHHVIMNDCKVDQPIYCDHSNKEIGRTYWGILNKYYDIALAKVTENIKVEYDADCYSFSGQLTKPTYNQKVKISGFSSGCSYAGKKILSTNAFVSTKDNKIFKNQILTEKISKEGDSGSLVVDTNTEHAVGLVFAGDNENFSVCNHIYKLFSEGIPNYVCSNGNILPEIKFEQILT